MPPSGYSTAQAESVVDFLRSCSQALRAEGVSFGRSPATALAAECDNIRVILRQSDTADIGTAVLALTLRFYDAVAADGPQDWAAFTGSVERALDQTRAAIAAIHVPS